MCDVEIVQHSTSQKTVKNTKNILNLMQKYPISNKSIFGIEYPLPEDANL